MKRQAIDWEACAKHISDTKNLYLEYIYSTLTTP